VNICKRSAIRTEWNRIINGRRFWFAQVDLGYKVIFLVERHLPFEGGREVIHHWEVKKTC